MNNNIKLLKIQGAETPSFNEPKGEKYEQAMKEIYSRVEAKRVLIAGSIEERQQMKAELVKLNAAIIMEDDEEKQALLITKKKEMQDKIEDLIDYSGLNIKVYAAKLINDEKIQKLKQDAEAEMLEILTKTRAYDKELRKLYQSIIEFTAGYLNDVGKGSSLATRRANSRYNDYDSTL